MNRSFGDRLADRIPDAVMKQLHDMEREIFYKAQPVEVHVHKVSDKKWLKDARAKKDQAFKHRVEHEFRQTYLYKVLSSGYTREIERR